MANIPGTAASEQLNGTSASDTFIGSGGSDTISGGGGNDFVNYGGITGFPGIAGPITATFSGFALYAGQVTKTTGTDTLTGIRGVAGTTSGDTLIGTDQTDASAPFAVILRGGGGNDTIDGRNNTMNQASYVSATAAVVIDLGAGTAQDGQGGTDTLTNVIRVIGSNFNDSITGSARADRFDVSLGNDSYIGGGGSDTIDYAGFALTNYKVTATFGTVAAGLFGGASVIVQKISTTGGTNYTDTGNSINQIRATAFDDTLSGTTSTYSYYSANLRGNGGNDTIDGKGLATNRADYSSATAAAAVDLAAGTAQDGLGGSDTLINVVAVRGSGFNDTLMGAISNDVFGWSDAGAHTANGRGGVNTVYFSGTGAVTIDLGTSASVDFGGYQGSIVKGGGVTDTLSNFANAQGGYGNDTVSGTAADNQLSGGMGSNTIDGRGGYDYVNYRYFSGLDDPLHGATVNLGNGLTGTATNAWNGTDALFNIEGAIGTQLADDITGADLANGAVSYIRGEGGNDTLRAPTATAHVTVDYQDSLSGVTVNLATGQTTDDGWFGGQDTLINIHALRGSAFNDSITGSTGSDTLDGGGGSDVLIGGDGDDSIVYDAADSSVDGGLGTDTLLVYDQGAPTSFSLTGHALEAAVVTTHDLANNQSYSQYDEYFNASWARTAENIFFDNGQQDQAHFDVNNATSFSSYVDHLSSAGLRASRDIYNDDGSRIAQTFDVSSMQSYSSYADYYTGSDQNNAKEAFFDDGSRFTQTFDVANNQTYTNYTDYYDASNRNNAKESFFDDGTRFAQTFDISNLQNYTNYTDYFDSANRNTHKTVFYDTGNRTEQTFDAGNATTAYASYVDEFNTSGTQIHKTVYYDDGTSAVLF